VELVKQPPLKLHVRVWGDSEALRARHHHSRLIIADVQTTKLAAPQSQSSRCAAFTHTKTPSAYYAQTVPSAGVGRYVGFVLGSSSAASPLCRHINVL